MCMCWGWRGSKKRGYEQGLGEEKGWGMGGRDVAGKSAKNCLNGEGFVQENMKRRNSHPIITPIFLPQLLLGHLSSTKRSPKKSIGESLLHSCVSWVVCYPGHTYTKQAAVLARGGGRGSNETCLLLLPLFPTHSHTGGGWVGIGERGLPSPSLLTTRRLSCSERGWM